MGQQRQALPRRPRRACSPCRSGTGGPSWPQAAGTQAAELGYFPLWTYAHPTAIELAARLAALAPGDLNRVFFTTGGGEAVESAWKLARQYFAAIGQPQRHKVISRDLAYHGTTMGALSITGLAAIRAPFEPLVPGTFHVPNTNRYRCRYCAAAPQCTLCLRRRHRGRHPRARSPRPWPPCTSSRCRTPAAASRRPTATSPGCARSATATACCSCPTRSSARSVGSGRCSASERLGYQPDMITMAKGLTSGYSPLGGVMVGDHIAEPFLEPARSFLHGITFGGHPVSCAVALANLDVFESEDLVDRVLTNEDEFRAALETLARPADRGRRSAGWATSTASSW